MTNQFPDATKMVSLPPPELVRQWMHESNHNDPIIPQVAAFAAQWGADQELDACCEWFQEFYNTESWVKHDLKHFRATRRPKPPTLKEQAIKDLDDLEVNLKDFGMGFVPITNLRKALEALPND
jgi:hypothetical protein